MGLARGDLILFCGQADLEQPGRLVVFYLPDAAIGETACLVIGIAAIAMV